MGGPISFQWDRPDIGDQVLRSLRIRAAAIGRIPDRAVRRGAALLVRMVRSNIQVKGLMRSRNLLRAVMMDIQELGTQVTSARVGVDAGRAKYAPWLERGTGIYGPLKRPITAKTKKALKFEIDGVPMIRRSVKGIQGRYYFAEAVQDFLPLYAKIIQEELANPQP